MNEQIKKLKHKKFKKMETDLFNKGQWYRLKKWNTYNKEKNMSRNLAYALSKLEEYCNKLNLSEKAKIDTVKTYTDALEHNILSGRSVEVVMASSIYIACRINQCPYSVAEIATLCNVTQKQVMKIYKIICKELKIKLPLMKPESYITRYCELLEVSDSITDRAITMCKEADEANIINGKSPTTVASTTIYLSSVIMGQKVTQRDIADTVGVSDVAIRKYAKILKDELSLPL
ncbi:MAG: transcription initiation factor IIB family protein [Bacilli bacterium]|nr:transcription initiation factor IIB family protein [Bacilli bacterium]